jgi:hypothetical protein
VCTAAVHIGLIDLERGGEVEYEIQPGLDHYEPATAHGVTSAEYGSYGGSFVFPAAPAGSGEFAVGPESWSRTAGVFAKQVGQSVTVRCSAGGPLGSVWGTGTYTSDSSICTAAVHAGVLDHADGGAVTLSIVAGQDDYDGTEANGVTSQSYGAYDTSFSFSTDG